MSLRHPVVSHSVGRTKALPAHSYSFPSGPVYVYGFLVSGLSMTIGFHYIVIISFHEERSPVKSRFGRILDALSAFLCPELWTVSFVILPQSAAVAEFMKLVRRRLEPGTLPICGLMALDSSATRVLKTTGLAASSFSPMAALPRREALPTITHRKSQKCTAATVTCRTSITATSSTASKSAPARPKPFGRSRTLPCRRSLRAPRRPTRVFFVPCKRHPTCAWRFRLLYVADPRVNDPRQARHHPIHYEFRASPAISPVLSPIRSLRPSRSLLLLLYLSRGAVLSSETLNDCFSSDGFPR
jgi:hypothetical protein